MAKIQITDQQVKALKLYEQGQTTAQIGEALETPVPTVRSWMGKFKKWGVFSGSQKERGGVEVDWDRLKKIKEAGVIPGDTDEIQDVLQTATDEIQDSNTETLQRNTKSNTGVLQRNTAEGGFTAEEIEVLKRLAGREIGRGLGIRSGKGQMVSGRLDSGLVAALKERADDEGCSFTEALNRAIEVYLSAGE